MDGYTVEIGMDIYAFIPGCVNYIIDNLLVITSLNLTLLDKF